MSESTDETNYPAEKRERGTPNALRRQPRGRQGEGRRYSYSVMAALDGATFAVLDYVATQRGVTRSWIIADMLREWASRQNEMKAVAPAVGPRGDK
jgi:hypothetical protein